MCLYLIIKMSKWENDNSRHFSLFQCRKADRIRIRRFKENSPKKKDVLLWFRMCGKHEIILEVIRYFLWFFAILLYSVDSIIVILCENWMVYFNVKGSTMKLQGLELVHYLWCPLTYFLCMFLLITIFFWQVKSKVNHNCCENTVDDLISLSEIGSQDTMRKLRICI